MNFTESENARANEIRERFNLPRVALAEVGYDRPQRNDAGTASVGNQNWGATERYRAIVTENDDLFGIVGEGYRLVTHEEGLADVEAAINAHRDVLGAVTDFQVESQGAGKLIMAKFRFGEREVPIGNFLDGGEDLVYPELVYVNSYDGHHRERIDFGAYRLVCSNGLVIGRTFVHLSRMHVGEDGLDLSGLPNAFEAFGTETECWRDWRGTDLQMCHVDRGVAPFGKAQTKEIIEAVDSNRPDNDGSLWFFYNVLTELITHKVESLRRRQELNGALKSIVNAWRN